jgi:hypothetical protein
VEVGGTGTDRSKEEGNDNPESTDRHGGRDGQVLIERLDRKNRHPEDATPQNKEKHDNEIQPVLHTAPELRPYTKLP